MKLDKCCCCVDLRIGCSILAIIGIFVNAGFFGTIVSLTDPVLGITNPSFYVIAIGSSIGIFGNLCLLFGSLTSNKTAISFYLLNEGSRLGLFIAFAILNFIIFNGFTIHGQSFGCSDILELPTISGPGLDVQTRCRLYVANGFFALMSVFLGIYAWICGFSLFQKISNGQS